jgi:Domain of unknown function (DUF4136)
MRRLIIGLGMCAVITAAVAGQMPKYGVTVKADKNVDFAKFKTYSWTVAHPSPDKTVNSQVIAAVDRELNALGMTKATSGPGDVLAAYSSLSRTDVNVKAKPDSKESRPTYAVGTLIVELLEPGNRRQLLQLRADQPIEAEFSKLEPSINSAVAAMFAEYPTRRRK